MQRPELAEEDGAMARQHPPIAPAHAEQLRVLFEAHFDFVWRLLARSGIPDADADDVAQQVFMVVVRRTPEVIRGGRERAFLAGVALRVAQNWRRGQQRRREVGMDDVTDPIDEAPGPDELSDHSRARALLDSVLARMPEDVRAVFVLFELEQLTSPEIARALDVAVGTVASRLRRGRELFQAQTALWSAHTHAARGQEGLR